MKIAIFGGSFDPLHKEHVNIIDGARSLLNVDRVVLLPTYNPPHKNSTAVSYVHRVNMLKIFQKTRNFVQIDETERELGLKKSYAYVVLGELRKKYPNDELYYLIGSDSLRKFEAWAHPEEILKLVKIKVITRGDDVDILPVCKEYSKRFGGEITVGFGAKEESSSALRLALELGKYEEIGNRIEPQILEYIKENGLYSRFSDLLSKLKSTLSERTYNHSLRTAEFMVENAWRVWADYDKALLSGLLHDCAKGRAPLKELCEYPTESIEVVHQYDGAEIARVEYGITDEEILDAIRYHTTAKPDFSPLGKLLYLADKLERGRSYPSVEKLRLKLQDGVDEAFKSTLSHGVDYLRARDLEIDLLTLRALEWYNI